jgi:hypothetical protein
MGYEVLGVLYWLLLAGWWFEVVGAAQEKGTVYAMVQKTM